LKSAINLAMSGSSSFHTHTHIHSDTRRETHIGTHTWRHTHRNTQWETFTKILVHTPTNRTRATFAHRLSFSAEIGNCCYFVYSISSVHNKTQLTRAHWKAKVALPRSRQSRSRFTTGALHLPALSSPYNVAPRKRNKNASHPPSNLRDWQTTVSPIENVKHELCWGNQQLYSGCLFHRIAVLIEVDWVRFSWWRGDFSPATLSKFTGRLIRTAVTISIILSQRRLVYNVSYFGILKKIFGDLFFFPGLWREM